MAKEKKPIEKASFNLNPEIIRKLKYVALMDQTTQTAILHKLLTDHVEKWEKKNGAIPVR